MSAAGLGAASRSTGGTLDARKADVVRLRLFCGLTVAQVGKALGVAKGTVERDWSFAKAWLGTELGG